MFKITGFGWSGWSDQTEHFSNRFLLEWLITVWSISQLVEFFHRLLRKTIFGWLNWLMCFCVVLGKLFQVYLVERIDKSWSTKNVLLRNCNCFKLFCWKFIDWTKQKLVFPNRTWKTLTNPTNKIGWTQQNMTKVTRRIASLPHPYPHMDGVTTHHWSPTLPTFVRFTQEFAVIDALG